jgi:hypothetical protein
VTAKKPPAERVTTNAAGEQIRTLPNGDCHLVPAHSAKAKIMAKMAAVCEEHRKLVDVKHVRVATKKARQARKGFPPEKSPI